MLRDDVPRVTLRRELAGRTAEAHATVFVLEQRDRRVGERRLVSGRDENTRLAADDVAVARDVGCNGGHCARKSARQHHPEALTPKRRRNEQLRALKLVRELVVAEE